TVALRRALPAARQSRRPHQEPRGGRRQHRREFTRRLSEPRAPRDGDRRHAVVGDTVRIQVRSHAFDVFANTLFTGLGSLIAGTVTQPLLPPIFAPEPLVVPDPFDPFNLPPNFPIHCAGSARTGGQRETFTLVP